MKSENVILVTGGAGFIGSNFVLEWLKLVGDDSRIINLDLLTYAGNMQNLLSVKDNERHHFIRGDIRDHEVVSSIFAQYRPRAVINFAAESHVDRSIEDPKSFLDTNVFGTYNLLEGSSKYFEKLSASSKDSFRFLHISTDEVFGSLSPSDPAFTEESKYEPNSPYSASKASSDHLVRAWHHTYKLPTLITNCSNNYGPFQFPEKLIPVIITSAMEGKNIPIYGDGKNIRDWLFVTDHCSAIRIILEKGRVGQSYNIGGNNEKTNLEVVRMICNLLDKMAPSKFSYSELISFVTDRPGHDRRYAINASKIQKEFGWYPTETFESGIEKTVAWYIENSPWVDSIKSGEYRK
ncbi:MAG: dTDP-glucose 4,6-dehydratase [Rickettsiaceae bacterium]|nr:dTDP-glucose 4,6-dehydratase [Rickettsiaceae bacterium]